MLSGQFEKRSRWTGLTAKVTFACLVNTILLLVLTYWLARDLASEAILRHELVDLRDESEARALYLQRKIIGLRNDLLRLKASQQVLSALAAPTDSTARDRAQSLFAARLKDKTEDEEFAREQGFESEPVYQVAFFKIADGATLVKYVGTSNPDIPNSVLAQRTRDYQARAEDEFARVIQQFESGAANHASEQDVYLSDIQFDQDSGQQSIWGVAKIAPSQPGTPVGYLGVQLNFSRIARELDQHGRLAMFVADRTGKLHVRPDVDVYKQPTKLEHSKRQNLQDLLPAEENTARSEFEKFARIEQAVPAEPTIADGAKGLRFKMLGDTVNQQQQAVKFSDWEREFLIGYVKPDSLTKFEERLEKSLTDDPDPKARTWEFNRLLWVELDKLRDKYPTLRFPVPSENENYRYLISGPAEAMDEAEDIIANNFHLKPRDKLWWPWFSRGKLEEYAMYVTKVHLDDQSQVDSAEQGRFLLFAAAASYEEIKADIEHTLEMLAWLLVLAVALSLVAAVWTWRRIVWPIQLFADATQTIGAAAHRGGEKAFNFPIERHDEIGDLARAFVGMDQRLRENQQLTSSIVRSVTEGIVTLGADRRIYELNPAAESLFGLIGSNSYLNQHYSVLLADEASRKRFEELFDGAVTRAFTGDSSRGAVARVDANSCLKGKRTDDGSEFFIAASVSRTPVEGKEYYTAIVRDVTDELTYQQELERRVQSATAKFQAANDCLERANMDLEKKIAEVEAAKFSLSQEKQLTETFIARTYHDINNPLSDVVNAEAYFANCTLDEIGKIGLKKIVHATNRIERMAKDTVRYAELIQGKLELVPKRFDVVELLKSIQQNWSGRAAKRQNKVVLKNSDLTCEAFTDQGFLERVVDNLINNACKFTQNGTITVRPSKLHIENTEWVVIEITDTGIGIAEEHLSKLFKPLLQRILPIEANPEGNGLGLASCRELIERLGGRIWCDSKLGHGSTFTLQIPLHLPESIGKAGHPEDATEEEDATAAAMPRIAGTVLVIDDDPLVANIIRERLGAQGFTVEVAHSGDQGLALAQTRGPSVITLDAIMPKMDGWAVLTKLRSNPKTRHIPVIMVSVTNDRRRGIGLGVDEYFTKPVDWDRLAIAVRKLSAEGRSDDRHSSAKRPKMLDRAVSPVMDSQRP
jgi:PAS domain S-box-containing protein